MKYQIGDHVLCGVLCMKDEEISVIITSGVHSSSVHCMKDEELSVVITSDVHSNLILLTILETPTALLKIPTQAP